MTIEPEKPEDLVGHYLELVGGTNDGMRFFIDQSLIGTDWSILTEKWITPTGDLPSVVLRERYLPDLVEGGGTTMKLTEDGRAVRYLLERR